MPAARDPRDRRPGAAGPAPARLAGQLLRFGLIGVASTLAYLLLYLLARETLSAQWANALALLVTAIANTAANRRLTFGVRGPAGRLRHQGQGLVVFALGLAVTSGSLLVLQRTDPTAARAVELAVLVSANVTATLLRFALFRIWLFPRRFATSRAGGPVTTPVTTTDDTFTDASGSRAWHPTPRPTPQPARAARHACAGCGAACGAAGPTTRPGRGRRCSPCWPAPPCST